MLRKASLCVVSLIAGLGLVSVASAAVPQQRTVYVGGHSPDRLFRVEPKAEAPYALTGADYVARPRTEPIFVGSRFAGVRQIGN